MPLADSFALVVMQLPAASSLWRDSSLGDSLGDSLGGSLGGSLSGSLGRSLGGSLGRSLGGSLSSSHGCLSASERRGAEMSCAFFCPAEMGAVRCRRSPHRT